MVDNQATSSNYNNGWWFGTMDFYDFPDKYWEWKIIPTDELTPSFFRGVGGSTTNQFIMNHH